MGKDTAAAETLSFPADKVTRPFSIEQRLRNAQESLALLARLHYAFGVAAEFKQDLTQGYALESAASHAAMRLAEAAFLHLAAIEQVLGATANADAPDAEVA